MGDFFKDLGNAVNKGFSDLGKSVNGEFDKMGKHTIENVQGDFDEVNSGMKKGGWLGGAAATFDVLSPGHLTAEGLDDIDLIPNDKNIKDIVAGGVNMGFGAMLLSTGNPVGLLYQADSIAEFGSGIGGIIGGLNKPAPAPTSPAGQPPMAPSQGNQSPSESKADYDERRKNAIDAAKNKAARMTGYEAGYEAGLKEGVREGSIRFHAEVMPERSGYHDGPAYGSPLDGLNRSYIDLLGRAEELYGKGKRDQVGDKLDKILNDPSLSFEDKIFFLMQGLVKDSQDEVTTMGDTLKKDSDKSQADIDKLSGQIDKLRSQGKKQGDPELDGLLDKRADLTNKRQESRQETFDKIQRATEKLQEMQQALSGVLNSMHDNAMSAIRNIK